MVASSFLLFSFFLSFSTRSKTSNPSHFGLRNATRDLPLCSLVADLQNPSGGATKRLPHDTHASPKLFDFLMRRHNWIPHQRSKPFDSNYSVMFQLPLIENLRKKDMKIFFNDFRTNGCSASFANTDHHCIQGIHHLHFVTAIVAVLSTSQRTRDRVQFIGLIVHFILFFVVYTAISVKRFL